jgi:hypothetical protein
MSTPPSADEAAKPPNERRDVGSMPSLVAPALLRRTSRPVLVSLIVIATITYYFWTAMLAAGGPPRIHGRESDHFNRLSRGFKNGHLHLDGEVPAALLNTPNPYDPTARGNMAVLHDASYFRGRYYIYFGPAPVVTLLLPFNLITGRDLPLPYAVWFFCSAGYLALASTFLFLQRRYFPRARLWTVMASLVALGDASMVVALLRRPYIWELPAASGFCFFAVSLWCLIRALHSPRAIAWAASGGLALGAAVAARPTYLLCSVMFVVPVVVHVIRRTQRFPRAFINECSPEAVPPTSGYDWRAILAAALGCGIPVLALLIYNYARFENPLEFGQKYQLSAIIEGAAQHFSLSYVPFNFQLYFLSALRWTTHFPFHHGIAIPPIPANHAGYEYTIGLFPNLPFSLFAIISLACVVAPRLRGGRASEFWLSLGIVATAAALNAALLLCYFGSCIRYMVEFTPCIMLLASCGLLECESRLRSSLAGNILGFFGLLVASFSAFAAAMAVVNFYDPVPGQLPRAYRPVARALNRPVFWLQQQRWPDYQPLEIVLSFPADRIPREEVLTTLTRGEQETAVVTVDYLEAEKIRLGYRENIGGSRTLFSPAVSARGQARHTLRLSVGGPYSDYDGEKSRLRAQLDDVPFWDERVVSLGAFPGKLNVAPAVAASAPAATHFTGVIHSTRSTAMPEIPPPNIGGIRVRLTLAPSMVGRAFPLITTGRVKAGDLFFIRVHLGDKISFGYDHWGDALLTSPEISARLGDPHVVEFWIPAVLRSTGEARLIVKVDGATVWERPAPAFPAPPDAIFLGKNPIGGSTCEPALESGVFEDVQLPLPKRAEN